MSNYFFPKIVPFVRCVEKYGTPRQATDDKRIGRTRVSCRLNKATSTDSEYVILIPFPRQLWLHERATNLRYSTLPVLSLFLYNCEELLLLSRGVKV
jgi:hypothetical protein